MDTVMADLLADYRYWWAPCSTPPWRPSVPREVRPHCGTWYALPAPLPTTAQWALVHTAFAPGRVLYTKSQAAAESLYAQIALADHPHVRLVPVAALEATLDRLLPPPRVAR